MANQRLFEIDEWKIKTNTFEKEHKRLQESLTSLGNGYMGIRGNFEESYSGDTHQGTYIAGVWFPDKTRVGWWKNGYPEYFGKVINAMNFIGIDVWIDGEKVDLYQNEIESFELELDMKEGILRRSAVVRIHGKTVRISSERFLSIAVDKLCAIHYEAECLTDDAVITLVPYLDGNVVNEDANYQERFWQEEAKGAASHQGHLVAKTIDNPFGTPRFTVSAAMANVTEGFADESFQTAGMYAENRYTYQTKAGTKVSLKKFIIVTTSRDFPETELVTKGRELLAGILRQGYEEARRRHTEQWKERWTKADIEIKGDDELQQGVRYNIFQLFSTYYGADSRLNIGPKGFTGEKYGGAAYWDTEAYAVPMYLAAADPEVTKNLLLYRYHHLEAAKRNAAKLGLKGALYPMVTFTGDECHNEWEITFEEIHRNGAICYAIYNYVNYTGDRAYIREYGIDVLVEISRFWADRVHFSKRKNKYMIHGVTGPNEYENNVNNNWYTNLIAAWTLEYTLENLATLPAEKRRQLNVREDEMETWKDIMERMYYPYSEELNIFIQHDTFLDKDLQTADKLNPAERPLYQHWSWDKILRSSFIKQADVLQGIYLFHHRFTLEEKRRNFEFYEPMTVHESSLSPSVHAVLAAELRMEKKALELFKRTARLDLDNYNHDTEEGLHITSMTGSWLALVQGFAGMRVLNGTLSFAPFLPKEWDSYTFAINFRGRLISINVTEEKTVIELLKGEPFELAVYDEPILLNGRCERRTTDG
ncbi:glycoside hydrolase family 65 protein [Bacillus sonorensis]|uniref:glycoside hydrolase family 65 protein n=1 Tax=Bacillus sonorensis TaxID=119858 RepID=UPI0022801A8B|nr:glycoside hydrolase family 65 protein [Bacillus sonorensis]MCZ0070723.1 glycoside hydrolase family 65 protein [Bacillus sonorensis]MCZ0098200.1 glycoside hydrolase family 65 protein [Bacillus sonorensis]MEC1519726.1 glycoside hydrolase family 65 protein [Bacillus sonorensis]